MILVKIYAVIFIADALLIALCLYNKKRDERKRIRQIINEIFNQTEIV